MAAKTKAALTCIDISCNIIRNLNLVHIIRTHTGSLPSCRKDIVSQEKHYVCKNLYFNRKYSTEHDNARRYRCSAKIYPAAKNYPPPVTLPSVLSAVCIAQN